MSSFSQLLLALLASLRIHYGKFVAESKFRSSPDDFTRAIRARDLAALSDLITKPVVEEQVLARVRRKAANYAREPDAPDDACKIPPEVIAQLYEHIMTLTKDVQIEYLLQRSDEDKTSK